MNKIRNYWKNKKGITLVWGAFFLILCLMFLGLAADIAYMYVAKNQLQVAADAASLAGAKLLNGTSSTTQLAARREAWKFACKNTAAGNPVFLVTNISSDPSNPNNCETPPTSGLNETTNDPNGDIVLGNWDPTRASTPVDLRFLPIAGNLLPTGAIINAVKVVPKRTTETASYGMPSVNLFIGKVFGWSFMSARANAIAGRPPLAAPGITICVPTCTAGPSRLILQKDTQSIPINDGMSWTAFTGLQAPDVGANGDVVRYIRGEPPPPPPLCDLCMTTNNSGSGNAIQVLKDVFESTTFFKDDKVFNASGNVISWKVALPVVDRSCDNPCPNPKFCPVPDPNNPLCNPDNCACPPGGQGSRNERYHVAQIATLNITSVITTGNSKGITIEGINCVGCPTSIPLSSGVKLVK